MCPHCSRNNSYVWKLCVRLGDGDSLKILQMEESELSKCQHNYRKRLALMYRIGQRRILMKSAELTQTQLTSNAMIAKSIVNQQQINGVWKTNTDNGINLDDASDAQKCRHRNKKLKTELSSSYSSKLTVTNTFVDEAAALQLYLQWLSDAGANIANIQFNGKIMFLLLFHCRLGLCLSTFRPSCVPQRIETGICTTQSVAANDVLLSIPLSLLITGIIFSLFCSVLRPKL